MLVARLLLQARPIQSRRPLACVKLRRYDLWGDPVPFVALGVTCANPSPSRGVPHDLPIAALPAGVRRFFFRSPISSLTTVRHEVSAFQLDSSLLPSCAPWLRSDGRRTPVPSGSPRTGLGLFSRGKTGLWFRSPMPLSDERQARRPSLVSLQRAHGRSSSRCSRPNNVDNSNGGGRSSTKEG